jgi:hypothetical protein
LLIGGPYEGRCRLDSPSRRLLFVCQPTKRPTNLPARRKSCPTGSASLSRGATDEDVQTLLSFYKRGRKSGNFDDGIRAALERVLVSPDFLFRIEADPAGVAPGL